MIKSCHYIKKNERFSGEYQNWRTDLIKWFVKKKKTNKLLISWLISFSNVSFQVFIFLGEVLISLNWAVMADILLVSLNDACCNKNKKKSAETWSQPIFFFFSFQYVVIPTRRATAEALQISVCHLLGDAGSPYLVGLVRYASTFPPYIHQHCFIGLECAAFLQIIKEYCRLHTCISRYLMPSANNNLTLMAGTSKVSSTACWSAYSLGPWADCFSSCVPSSSLTTGRPLKDLLKVRFGF